MLSGIWLPLVTPLRDDVVDVAALQRLAAHYLKTGLSGFVALGTTGEAALLTAAERRRVLQAVLEVADGQLPVLIGVGGIDTRDVCAEIRRHDAWLEEKLFDCAGYLVAPPAYLCPDQAGVEWHFRQVAGATDRSIVLYDVPHRCGVGIEPVTVERLADTTNIVAIKACERRRFEALAGLRPSLLCGTDDAFVDALAAGAAGGILASAHLCGDLLLSVQELMATGREPRARALFDLARPLLQLLFAAPNPAAIKAALALQHPISAQTRMPIVAASADLSRRLANALLALRRASDV